MYTYTKRNILISTEAEVYAWQASLYKSLDSKSQEDVDVQVATIYSAIFPRVFIG